MINHFRLKPTDVLLMHKIFRRRFFKYISFFLLYKTIFHSSLNKRNKKCSDFWVEKIDDSAFYDCLKIKMPICKSQQIIFFVGLPEPTRVKHLLGVPLLERLALPANVRLSWKSLPGTNNSSSLLRKSVNYGQIKLYNIVPWNIRLSEKEISRDKRSSWFSVSSVTKKKKF